METMLTLRGFTENISSHGISWNFFHLNFLFSLWKLGLISWLDLELWSEPLLGWRGTNGFFAGAHKLIVMLPVLGETAFLFKGLGASSLSKIFEVLVSISLMPVDGDPTDWSGFGFNEQEGEYLLGISSTINSSHSSIIHEEFSTFVKSNNGFSSSETALPESGYAFSSRESEWTGVVLGDASFSLGGINLEILSQKTVSYLYHFSLLLRHKWNKRR